MAKALTPDQLLAALKAEGLTVVEVPGWRDRCRCHAGSHAAGGPKVRAWGEIHGTVTHITGGDLGKRTVLEYIRDIINGDRATPTKSQLVTAPNGHVYVNSAGRCNHAGKVGAQVPTHLIEADFSLTDDYDDRWRGAAVDGNTFTIGNEVITSKTMTAQQYKAAVLAAAAIARACGWTGQESVGHGEISAARFKVDPGLHMGNFRRDVMDRVKTKLGTSTPPKPTTPAPTPKPPATGTHAVKRGDTLSAIAARYDVRVADLVAWNGITNANRIEVGQVLRLTKPAKPTAASIRVMSWNLKSPTLTAPISWAIRRGRQVAEVKRQVPSVLLVQEAGSPSHVRWYDKALKPLGLVNARAVDAKGSGKWRVIYYRAAEFELVASGLYNLPADTLYKGDQKPMVWAVLRHRVTGELWVFSSAHLENDAPADEERPEQMLAVLRKVDAVAKQYDVPAENRVVGVDTNSQSYVRSRVHDTTRYRDIFTRAAKTTGKDTASHNAWKDARRGARIDVIFTTAPEVLDASQASTPKAADHNPQTGLIAA